MSGEHPKAMIQEQAESEAVRGEKHPLEVSPRTTVVELGATWDDAPAVPTFAIEEKDTNTAKNPFHESTQVCPTLVRRTNSEELLPRPFKSTTQLVCASYLSLLCCCACAAFAVKHAWNAKLRRNQGVYTSAIHAARKSCYLMVAALVGGSIIWLTFIVIAIVKFS